MGGDRFSPLTGTLSLTLSLSEPSSLAFGYAIHWEHFDLWSCRRRSTMGTMFSRIKLRILRFSQVLNFRVWFPIKLGMRWKCIIVLSLYAMECFYDFNTKDETLILIQKICHFLNKLKIVVSFVHSFSFSEFTELFVVPIWQSLWFGGSFFLLSLSFNF